jgi:hypothetical protein
MNFECHDWVFIGIEFDWGSGESYFRMRDGTSRDRAILARRTTSVRVAREHPWGRSVNVNSIREEVCDQGRLLVIEMQSGDLVEYSADSFELI